MTNQAMTFHECYGNLPVKTLRLIKRNNVSPSDFDFMLDQFSLNDWSQVDDHIVSNSDTGMYRPRFF